MLELKGVTKVYNVAGAQHKVLKNITINFRGSEFAAILGPSGSGKTTLLNIIGGLDQCTHGDLKINEVSTKRFRSKDWDSYRNHRIGFVFQNYNLIPHQTVLANVKLALTLSGISKREAIRRAKKALTEVGLGAHINKKPSQLSGGQMQRVAIARALVNDPDILLADEPTGALDSETSIQVMKILKKISEKKLVIMVTHNPELADEYATRIITLKDGSITSDSNPYDGKEDTAVSAAEAKSKRRKTKMSFITALSLSLQNLLTKKGRTILVAFAGSIGIIGIALILAVSNGLQTYIDKIQSDTLTSYPLTIQQESVDITGILLGVATSSGNKYGDGKVHENQMLTTTLGSVAANDLGGFEDYLEANYDKVRDDITYVENKYNVDPLIYTVDATGELAKLNPSDLFSSLLGGSSVVNAYSSMTSVYQQYDRSLMERDLSVVAGRLPEKYDEMVIMLTGEEEIQDLLTYSLGLHDTSELSTLITEIMGGGTVSVDREPLTLTYEDLMNLDLRLVRATDTYKYNAKYDVYEDMSGDAGYMEGLYENAERLKIVGVATPREGMMTATSGVLYLPELVTHIIEEAGETEIVKRQLANPTIDIFSNKPFGEDDNSFDFEFSDLVSVDESALSRAFKTNIDQNAVTAKTKEYMNTISEDITADISPVKTVLTERLDSLKAGFNEKINELMLSGTFDPLKYEEYVSEFMAGQDFSELEAEYLVPAETFRETFTGLLKLSLPGVPEEMAGMVELTIQTLSVKITEAIMKKEILTEVGGLTAYLSSSFANAFSVDQDALISAFRLNFSEDELARVVSAMFNETEASLSGNLSVLGYQDLEEPFSISFYFNSFDGKTRFMEFIDEYNELMESYGNEDKVIQYSDTTGALMDSVKVIVDAVSYVLIAFVSISLVVSSIMIGIITYISVYERTKEIGILRAIGASKHNISSIFNAETFIVGLLSGLIGIGVSYVAVPIINLVLYNLIGDIGLYADLPIEAAGILVALSIVLTLIGGLIPARAAAKKDPVEALRSE
ncbi:MAG: ABC transporter ATP-binding protein/permease [Candidatus Saccharibacteria bacterium]|nr:ABC transporter ATP-binding protein/permease [Candidatus Saccharibacteria bacterium]